MDSLIANMLATWCCNIPGSFSNVSWSLLMTRLGLMGIGTVYTLLHSIILERCFVKFISGSTMYKPYPLGNISMSFILFPLIHFCLILLVTFYLIVTLENFTIVYTNGEPQMEHS